MAGESINESNGDAYVAPTVEPLGSVPEVTFGVAPAVPVDTTFINARPIGVVS